MRFLAMLRFWREGIIGALLLTLVTLWIGKSIAERQNGKLTSALHEATALIERERADVRARTALAQAQDAAHAAAVERDQIQATQEVTDDYQRQIAALRARYDALRVRAGATAADPGGGGTATMPAIPVAARRVDGAAGEGGLSQPDRLIASEQALRLKALQDWVRAQATLAR